MAKKTLTQQTQTLDGHTGLGDRPNINDGLSASQLKTRYDRDVNRNKDYINNTLIDELQESTTDDSGAQAIGFDNLAYGDNVADALDTIISAGSGSVPPDGTVTNAKLATDVKVGSLALLDTTDKSDVVSAINEVKDDASTEQYSESNAEQSTTSTSYVDALSMVITSAGDYIVSFLADIESTNDDYDVSMQVLHESTTLYEHTYDYNQYTAEQYRSISGIAKITASASDTLKIQYKIASGGTGNIRNARLHIKKYQGS